MMLLRVMMVLFLLIVSAMPAWAGEKESVPIEASSAPAAEQMTMEKALSKVTIEAEDWLDGDTYYIRFTFTNPTDVQIEKDILYTGLYLFAYWNDTRSDINKVDMSPNRHLSIAPHSKTTMVLSFPKEYTHDSYSFGDAHFFFSPSECLSYILFQTKYRISDRTKNNLSKTDTYPVFFNIIIIPPDEKNGLSKLSLTIDNQTPQFFHTMRDLNLSGAFYVPSTDRNVRIKYAKQGPITVDISPYSKKAITFSVFAEDMYEYYIRDFSSFLLTMSLDNKYYEHSSLGYNTEVAYRTLYTPEPSAPTKSDSQDELPPFFYYLKDGKVHCFFKVHNQYDKPCTLSHVSFFWRYMTPFSTIQHVSREFYGIHKPIHLRVNESRYYTFSFDIPPDYFMSHESFPSYFSYELHTSQDFFFQHFPLKEKYISPIRQSIYLPFPPSTLFQ